MTILSILPILICSVIVFLAKKNALWGACIGILSTIILILIFPEFSISKKESLEAVKTSLIITFGAAIVIIPGLYFNFLLKTIQIIKRIQLLVESLPYSKEHKALLLIFGILPAIESLTGFGVSLFLSIPILFHLFKPRSAYRLAMMGMHIMPWGTMALATVVGAGLSGISLSKLGIYSSYVSFLIFPMLALICIYVIGGVHLLKKRGFSALCLGSLLSLCLILFNSLKLIEISGVAASCITFIVGLIFLPKTGKLQIKRSDYFLFSPYILVLLLIVLERVIPGLFTFLQNQIILRSEDISLSLLTSPGLVLLITTLAIYFYKPVPIQHKSILRKARGTCFSLFLFILLSQIMFHNGMIATFAASVSTLDHHLLFVISPVISMFSGFITGSNVSGNALTMVLQSNIGKEMGAQNLFAAIQNCGSGHAIFTSIPIILLIFAIAKDCLPKGCDPKETQEHDLLKFGAYTSLFILLALISMSLILYYHLY